MTSSARPFIIRGGAARTQGGAWHLDNLAGARKGGLPVPDPAAEAAAAHGKEIADAYSHGFEEGRREGEHTEQARLRKSAQSVVDALDVIRSSEERWSGALEENIGALACAVARHIVDREIASDPELVSRLVKRAIAEFRIDQPVRVRVNPNDLSIIEAAARPDAAISEDGEPASTNARDLHWIGDPRIASGGCVVEGRERIVDGRVDTALERAYRRVAYHHA
jgi:flagellar biosynthesis/type III secretory pathway protein FliH